jgi:hypothetical protein
MSIWKTVKRQLFFRPTDNRRAIKSIVKDAEVLGAFTYTGTFEIHAAYMVQSQSWESIFRRMP